MLKSYLLAAGVSEEAYQNVDARCRKEKITFLAAFEAEGVMSTTEAQDLFAKYYRVPAAKLDEMDLPPMIISLLSREVAVKHRVIPIDKAGNNLIVAMSDPRNLVALQELRSATGYTVKAVLACDSHLSMALAKYYSNNMIEMKKDTEPADPVKDKGRSVQAMRFDISAAVKDQGPVVVLVNQILSKCIETKASDIHIEPYESDMRARLRIDGVLHEIVDIPMPMRESLIARIKILASLNIAEKRLPQDGSIKILIDGRPIDFRVSCLPTLFGEKIVMRILDRSSLQVDMEKLGFDTEELKLFQAAIRAPFGMVLVTGPTGSGKTTTLYSALSDLNKTTDNIMTAEDPVEFSLRGINQTQMKAEIGMNFAAALRAFLRQDPDVVMIGEVRDLETAEIAVKASLTGHLVLSTLHTNSAVDTIARLLNMGLEPFNLASALTCVTAQRLLRKICPHCRAVDDTVTPQVMIDLGIHPHYADKVNACVGKGCAACAGTGMKGRVAVHEVLKINDPVRNAIIANLPSPVIKTIAMQNGMRSLRQSALSKMVAGLIPAAEVTAATGPDKDEGSGSAAA